MRKLSYFIGSTIDGFIAAPDGGFDFFFPHVTGEYASYLTTEYPDTVFAPARAGLGIGDAPNKHYDTVLMGRATYEPGLAVGATSPYAHLRQIVFSRSIAESPDPAVEVTAEDPLSVVRRLKREDGLGIWLCGGASLAGQLLPEIDELVVKLYPVVAGSGIPLFSADFAARNFELVESRTFDQGSVLLTYRKPATAADAEPEQA
ncbi:dihydrofolate reductase family protein [Kitasatospora sp. A2-31]|uniref:dihydrofolate reductase family protein n=1 Tax=Kitasatospora sp. A2-31 TaxID=2916414 RepID=UPI001EEB2428|nr:dihydrofolate reductase family protein [Kitasatospora sp. A2-31]MCG6494948.1 dihydrofolate reductase family protein [Kitasatospora sp. A2-31]